MASKLLEQRSKINRLGLDMESLSIEGLHWWPVGPGKAAVNASNELNLAEGTRNLDVQFIQVIHLFQPDSLENEEAAGNMSEHHTSRSSWNSSRTEVNCCEICSSCDGRLLSQNKTMLEFRIWQLIQPTVVVDLSTWRKATISTCQQNSTKMHFTDWVATPFHLYNDSRLIVIGSVWVIHRQVHHVK